MSVLTSLGILILSLLIFMLMQLSSGIFLLFSHYNKGKFSRRKAADLNLFYIVGAEIVVAMVFLCVYYVISALSPLQVNLENGIIVWTIVGALLAISFLFFSFYYHKGSGTKLFISRRFASAAEAKAKAIKSRSDAFALGYSAAIPELIFTLPLYFICSLEIMRIGTTGIERAFLILLFILASLIQLFIINFQFANHRNLAEIQRSRVRNKPFIRSTISFLYLLIAILIITFRIILP